MTEAFRGVRIVVQLQRRLKMQNEVYDKDFEAFYEENVRWIAEKMENPGAMKRIAWESWKAGKLAHDQVMAGR